MPMFDAKQFINDAVQELKNTVKGKAMIAFSGGVDSTVCAALVNKAIGKDLIAVHVDTGYMRKNESDRVVAIMKQMGLHYRFVDARSEFYNALK